MSEPERPSEVLLWALAVVELDYAVVGSIASSAFGDPRATADIDMVARFTERQLERLSLLLGANFYFDLDTAKEALRAGRSFNIISLRDLTKFDFFPSGTDAFGALQLARKRQVLVKFLSDVEVPVASPEDVILAKLRWYDQTGRTSEKQWNDILGVLRVQAAAIDWTYIESWAPQLGVADLLPKLPRFA